MPIIGNPIVKRNVFTVKRTQDGKLLVDNKTVSIREQMTALNSANLNIEDLGNVSVVQLVDGSAILYNAATNKYEIRPIDCGEYS